jgi:hypothetical protein
MGYKVLLIEYEKNFLKDSIYQVIIGQILEVLESYESVS